MQGNALAARAQYREALKNYDKILAKVPGNLDVINNRANCLSALGRYEHAITSYGTILAARPNDIRARTNRASALKQLGRFFRAQHRDASSSPRP
jgi:tetratricopeptide (TPR) repeat protein